MSILLLNRFTMSILFKNNSFEEPISTIAPSQSPDGNWVAQIFKIIDAVLDESLLFKRMFEIFHDSKIERPDYNAKIGTNASEVKYCESTSLAAIENQVSDTTSLPVDKDEASDCTSLLVQNALAALFGDSADNNQCPLLTPHFGVTDPYISLKEAYFADVGGIGVLSPCTQWVESEISKEAYGENNNVILVIQNFPSSISTPQFGNAGKHVWRTNVGGYGVLTPPYDYIDGPITHKPVIWSYDDCWDDEPFILPASHWHSPHVLCG
eukprot:Platyproteum_vivax@DN15285_c0_g1_i1.p1